MRLVRVAGLQAHLDAEIVDGTLLTFNTNPQANVGSPPEPRVAPLSGAEQVLLTTYLFHTGRQFHSYSLSPRPSRR